MIGARKAQRKQTEIRENEDNEVHFLDSRSTAHRTLALDVGRTYQQGFSKQMTRETVRFLSRRYLVTQTSKVCRLPGLTV